MSPYEIDPFTVPTHDKVTLLGEYSARLAAADGVDHVTASLDQVKEQVFYADTAGSRITQQRVRLQPQLQATAVDQEAGLFETMRTLAPPVGRGYEFVTGADGCGMGRGLARIPQWLAEKVKAPTVEARPTDLVIDPTNLWLTIHESIGHATEYDRAIGYESAYAGTSFATPDKLGTYAVRCAVHARHRGPGPVRAGDGGLRRRGCRRPALGPDPRRCSRRLPARPCVRATARACPVQRLLVCRFAAPRADPADGQRLAAAGPDAMSAPRS